MKFHKSSKQISLNSINLLTRKVLAAIFIVIFAYRDSVSFHFITGFNAKHDRWEKRYRISIECPYMSKFFLHNFDCNVLVYYMQHKACITFSFHIQYQMRDGHKSRDYN